MTQMSDKLSKAAAVELTRQDIEEKGRGCRPCSLRGDKCLWPSCDYECAGRQCNDYREMWEHNAAATAAATNRALLAEERLADAQTLLKEGLLAARPDDWRKRVADFLSAREKPEHTAALQTGEKP